MQHRFFYLLVGPVHIFAMPSEDFQPLFDHLVCLGRKEIAGIPILRYEAQGLSRTHTANQDGRMGLAEGLGVIDRVG